MSAQRALTVAIIAAVGAVVAILVTPDVAQACAMCFSGPEESRKAFFVTAAFLTLLPLGMVAGAATWLRSRARSAAAERGDSNRADASGN